MSVVSIVPVGRVLLRDQALQLIRDAIVSGELAPGAVVKDADLAARLGLSVAPVRAALARLADEGLVEAKPQSHTRVTPLVVRQVRDAAAVVRAMHELAGREAAGRTTDDDVTAMRAANERFAAAVTTGDVDAAIAADDDLHGVLLRRAGNAALAAHGGRAPRRSPRPSSASPRRSAGWSGCGSPPPGGTPRWSCTSA